MIPRGRLFSIERGVFPRLAQAGSLYGYVDRGYWRDIGTPESYLQAHFDILERTVDTAVADVLGEQYLYVAAVGRRRRPGARRAAVLHRRERARRAPAPGSARWPCSAPAPWSLKGRRSSNRSSRPASSSARTPRSSAASSCARAAIGAGTQLHSAVIGEGCRVGAGNRLVGGICLYPETVLARQLHPVPRAAPRQGGLMTIPDGIFKAYDVRGLYPQELDEEAAERIGCALAQQLGATPARHGHGPAPVVHGSARGVRRRRRRRRRLHGGLRPRAHGDAVLRRRLAGPRRRRHGHGLAQPAAVQRYEAGRRRGPAAERRRRASPSSSSAARRSSSSRARAPPPGTSASICTPPTSPTCGLSSTPRRCGRTAWSWTPPTGSPESSPPWCSTARPSTAWRCTSRSTAPSPTTRPTRCSRRTAARSARGSWPRRPIWASPGTATPTAASSSTSTASSCPATSSRRCSPRRCCSSTRARPSSTTCAPAGPCRT